MGKADELLKTVGGIIAESASVRATPAAMPSAAATTAPPGGDRLAGVTRSKAAMEIPLAKIERDTAQPREEFDPEALGRLETSIRANGVLQPIGVRWDEGRGRYMILFGERRFRAAGMAGLASIPCVVSDRPMDPAERLAVQLVENALREDLKPLEQAKAYRALMDARGWSGNTLAKELGISQSSVVQALRQLELPAAVQARIESGELAPSVAYEISKLDDPEAQKELADRAVSEGLSRAEVKVRRERETTAASKARGQGRGAKAKVKPRKTAETIRTANGYRITAENRKGVDGPTLLAALIEAADTVRARLAGAEAA